MKVALVTRKQMNKMGFFPNRKRQWIKYGFAGYFWFSNDEEEGEGWCWVVGDYYPSDQLFRTLEDFRRLFLALGKIEQT